MLALLYPRQSYSYTNIVQSCIFRARDSVNHILSMEIVTAKLVRKNGARELNHSRQWKQRPQLQQECQNLKGRKGKAIPDSKTGKRIS